MTTDEKKHKVTMKENVGGYFRAPEIDEIFVQFRLKPVKGETFLKFKFSSCRNGTVAVLGYEVNGV